MKYQNRFGLGILILGLFAVQQSHNGIVTMISITLAIGGFIVLILEWQ